jgi:cobalt/nickel transport system permease protein
VSAIDYAPHADQYERLAPQILRVDPRVRLLLCLAFALATISLTHLLPLSGALVLAGICACAARLDLAVTLRRMASLDGFMVFVVGFLPFTMPGAPAFTIAGFIVSQAGLEHAAAILLASNAVVLMILALVGTMKETELGMALSSLHAPAKLTHLLLLTTRYIDVLRREYRRLRISMKVRAFRMGFNLHTWKMIGYLFGMLLVRSIERSERIVIAMRCRGYRGELHMLCQPPRISAADRAIAGLSSLAMVMLVVLDRL